MKNIDEKFMRSALQEARKAMGKAEVPVGAVLVKNNRIIARGYNKNIHNQDPAAHAEIVALTGAGSYLKNHRLIGCTLYATVEPCPMCAGALVHARVKRIVFGAGDPKAGACGSVFNIASNKKLNHRIEVTRGILEKECAHIVKEFFRTRRK
jgi:tRNA(adenine34) deaminase